MARFLLLNGPNLNLLGTREPETYGQQTLAEIEDSLTASARSAGHHLDCFQSNAEHELVERIQAAAAEGIDALLVNPAALGHTSVALRDALLAAAAPFVEIHISNIYAREPFRHKTYLSDIAAGCIVGLGTMGYRLALQAAMELVEDKR